MLRQRRIHSNRHWFFYASHSLPNCWSPACFYYLKWLITDQPGRFPSAMLIAIPPRLFYRSRCVKQMEIRRDRLPIRCPFCGLDSHTQNSATRDSKMKTEASAEDRCDSSPSSQWRCGKCAKDFIVSLDGTTHADITEK